MSDSTPSFFARLSLAFACFFRVIADPAFAAKLARPEPEALPEQAAPAALPPVAPVPSEPEPKAEAPKPERVDVSALTLLALLQREGRFVDFVEQDVESFSDADVGAAARVVHAGCRRALRAHLTIEPVRKEDEGSRVAIEDGYDPASIKLVGDVRGRAPYRGALRHRGWRATELRLPELVAGHDATFLAAAEVEL